MFNCSSRRASVNSVSVHSVHREKFATACSSGCVLNYFQEQNYHLSNFLLSWLSQMTSRYIFPVTLLMLFQRCYHLGHEETKGVSDCSAALTTHALVPLLASNWLPFADAFHRRRDLHLRYADAREESRSARAKHLSCECVRPVHPMFPTHLGAPQGGRFSYR